MQIASITDTKNNLSFYLDMVRNGETVVITDRHRPIARLEPIHFGETDDDGRLNRLERSGIIRRSKGKIDVKKLLDNSTPAIPGVDILKILLQERAEGR
jgi:prevent-host-death family protein